MNCPHCGNPGLRTLCTQCEKGGLVEGLETQTLRPLNAVNLTVRMNADNDEEVKALLLQLVTDFDLYGVRSFIASDMGIVDVVRRDVTPEQHRLEVDEAARKSRERRMNREDV